MKSVYKLILPALLCSAWQANAQVATRATDTLKHPHPAQRIVPIKPKGPKAIAHELSAGVRLNTDGWSGYMDFGRVKPKSIKPIDMFYNVSLWQVEFSEKKSPKQEKIVVDDGTGNTNSYFYGKINNFYALKLGYGYSKMLAGKPDPGSVSIHWLNVVGFSLGLLKPYYINVEGDPSAIKYSESTKNDFLTQVSSNGSQHIIGSAGFSKGLSEMTYIPGAHFKSALHFDFSANKKNVVGAEVGFNIEYYSANVPLMAGEDAKPYFADLFLAVQFGKRW